MLASLFKKNCQFLLLLASLVFSSQILLLASTHKESRQMNTKVCPACTNACMELKYIDDPSCIEYYCPRCKIAYRDTATGLQSFIVIRRYCSVCNNNDFPLEVALPLSKRHQRYFCLLCNRKFIDKEGTLREFQN